MGFGSVWHWLLVMLVLVLLFGSGKISGLMGDLAKGIKSFKKEMSEDGAEAEAEPEPEPAAQGDRAPHGEARCGQAETGRPGQGAARSDQVQVELTPPSPLRRAVRGESHGNICLLGPMFDIGWSELLVIAVVAIVVVGPKELPRLMRTFGHYMGKVRRMASDFQRQFEEAVRDSELDEVRKAMHEVRATASVGDRARSTSR